MKLYGRFSLATLLKLILSFLLGAGVLLFFYISYRIYISDFIHIYKLHSLYLYAFFVIGGSALGHLIYRFIKITDSLIANEPFTKDNVKSLKWISIDCFIVSCCYVLNFLINPMYGKVEILMIDGKGIHTDVEYLIFLFAGCFILILSKVFEQAVAYKEENDLTV